MSREMVKNPGNLDSLSRNSGCAGRQLCTLYAYGIIMQCGNYEYACTCLVCVK